MNSVQDSVLQSIRARKKGSVLFVDAFETFGSSEAVRQAFSRLQKMGLVVRLAKGIYMYSVANEKIGVSMEKIAFEVAARDKARILPTGIYAQNRLGLSSQIQTNLVFITDGTPRNLKLGNKTIKFKKGVAGNFAYKSETIYLIVAALREMFDLPNGQMNFKIRELLKNERIEILKHDLALAPQRIRRYLQTILRDENQLA